MKPGWRLMAVTVAVLGTAAVAQNGPESRADSRAASRPVPTTPAEKLAAIEAEYESAMDAFSEAYKAAKSKEDKEKVREDKFPKADAWYPRMLEVAKDGGDVKSAINALVWVISHGATTPAGKEALGLLASKHINSPEIKKAFGPLARSTSPANEQFIRTAMNESPHAEVRAQATYSLAQMLKYRADVAAIYADKSNAEAQKNFEKRFKEDEREMLMSLDPVATGKEVEKLLERVMEMTAEPGVGELKVGWGVKLAETVTGDLFEIRNLAVGMVAPEITAEDLDGKPLKLSDFRGKVVVLDFWGHW